MKFTNSVTSTSPTQNKEDKTMKNNTKKEYSAPELTMVTFQMEKGFAFSNPNHVVLSGQIAEDVNDFQSQETWNEVDHTSEGWF